MRKIVIFQLASLDILSEIFFIPTSRAGGSSR